VGDLHRPVLLAETMELLQVRPGGLYVDGTLGLAGHAREILRLSEPDGRLLGVDRDTEALALAKEALLPAGTRARLVHADYREIPALLAGRSADGILLDLGVSSLQLDRRERGFSFQAEGPLDMRMDQSQGETAGELLRRLDETELETIIRDYGEERYARRIARAIVEARDRGELDSTGALGTIVARAMPRHEWHKNPATRTFQALRIAVNQELTQIERLLDQMADCLRPGGRLCIIAFHSLEDRIVKRRLRELAGRGGTGAPARVRLLNKHVIVAGDEERERNPRARSAKLRAAERI
jgi:16S rRNA (cytosine1402-N4)-methyltransferase